MGISTTPDDTEFFAQNGYVAGALQLNAGSTKFNADSKLVMQTDGNLVLYGFNNVAYWSTQTSGRSCTASTCVAVFQADGNLVLYQNGSAYWASHTNFPGSKIEFSLASPHARIVSASGHTMWTGQQSLDLKAGEMEINAGSRVLTPNVILAMQTDGNLVVYDYSWRP